MVMSPARSAAFALALAAGWMCASGPASADPPANRSFTVKWSLTGLNKTLNGVRFADRRIGWAVGDGGTIIATANGGASWQSQTSGSTRPLFGVSAADARNAWVVGATGTVLATSDGGANWRPQQSGTQRSLRDVHFINATTGWAVGDAGIILTTVDAGATWRAQTSGTQRSLLGVHFVNPQSGWAVGVGGVILATQDGGASWRVQPTSNRTLRGVYFVDVQIGWAVGSNGTILATTDAGATWQVQSSGTGKNLQAVWFVDARQGWAVGDDGTILVTKDGGTTWVLQRSGTEKALNGVHVVDGGTGWAVGIGGAIVTLQSEENTSFWRNANTNEYDLYHVYFVDSRAGWVVGDNGTIRATSDGGATWQTQPSGTESSLRGVRFVDPQTGWVAGVDGVILKTRDGGKTWNPQKSGTQKTFGGIDFVDAQSGWAAGIDGLIVATTDGGQTWHEQVSGTDNSLENVRFADPQTGWAVGDAGTIVATRDGGATWQTQDSKTEKSLFHLHFVGTIVGWAVGEEGTILATSDGGQTWTKQNSGVQADLYHVHFANASTGWIVGKEGTLLATSDGGNTWQKQRSLTDKTLASVHFGSPESGWAVGFGGVMLRAQSPSFAPWADSFDVSPLALENSLDLSFAVHADSGPDASEGKVEARGVAAKAAWNTLGTVKKPDTADKRWHLVWKPADFNIHSGDNIEYRVTLTGVDQPPAAPVNLGKKQFDPYLAKLWRENADRILATLAAFGLLILYAALLGLIILVKPAWPARWGSAPVLDDLPKPSGNVAFWWELGRKAIGLLVFPWVCRLPRVRRAWTKEYIAGKSTFDDLGKARPNFVSSPEVLDAWVARVASKADAALAKLDLVQQRRIYVELPVRAGDSGKLIERPNAETLRPLFAQERAVVGIIGGGGSGKSTLGCAIARWALSADPGDRLLPHRMIPVFIVQDTTNLIETVTQNLHRMLGDESLPDDLVRGLLAKQRILVIIDALSERLPETQAHIEQVFGLALPLNAIIITSRTEPQLGSVDRTMLYPVRLDAARVVPFIIGYLDRMADVGLFKDGRLQLRLGDQILALAESGGQKTPITPLLVTLFVKSAVQRAMDGLSFDGMPQAVPEVFVDYLRRLYSSPAQGEKISEDMFIQATQTLATVCVGHNLVPQDFSMDDAIAGLSAALPDCPPRVLIDRLVASGVVERRTPGGYVALRFSVDPAAEYFAAIRQLFKMRRVSHEDWNAYLSSLTGNEGYPKAFEGYLVAFATCYRAYKRDFALPDVPFPWEKVAEPAPPPERKLEVAAE